MEECSCLASFLRPSLSYPPLNPSDLRGGQAHSQPYYALPVQLSDLTNLLANPRGAEGRRFEYSASISVSGMPGASSCCLDGQAVVRRSLRQSDIPRFQAPRNPLHSSPLFRRLFLGHPAGMRARNGDCGGRRGCRRPWIAACQRANAAAAAPVANGKCRRGERSAFSSNCRAGRR